MVSDSMPEETDRSGSEIDGQVEKFFLLWSMVRQQMMGAHFKQQHQLAISATQFMVLGVMDEARGREPCTIGSLANRLGLDPATLVRTVDSLEKRGWVERRRDTQDRRQVFVEFTRQGLAKQEALIHLFKMRLAEIVRSMSDEGRVSLLKGLQEFVNVGQQLADKNDISH